jgi:predicted 3-demethylubiquinone-9 3-methyltransferase (glyoxalase superfamily)
MTALDGWVHDRFGSAWMLHTDALTGIVCTVIGLFVLQKIRAAGRATRSRPETIRP